MGKIDKLQRQILNVNANFIDAISKTTRKYNIEILPDELEDVYPSNVVFDKDGNVHEIIADIRKCWKREDTILALFGIECQTSVDKTMVYRIMEYDAAKYLEQAKKDPDECRQVVTFVLNFGKSRWNGPTTLRECVKYVKGTASQLSPLANDYKIYVIDVCDLTLEEIEPMKSDFRFYATLHYNLCHPDEPITYPAVRDGELAHNYVNVLSSGKIDIPAKTLEQGGFQMSQLFDEYAAYRTNLLITKSREEGIKEGIEKGIEKGERKRERAFAQRLSEKGYSIAAIADLLGETEETIEGLLIQD